MVIIKKICREAVCWVQDFSWHRGGYRNNKTGRTCCEYFMTGLCVYVDKDRIDVKKLLVGLVFSGLVNLCDE